MEISNKRCIQILKLLLKNKECMTGDNLAVAIGVSSRTIRNDMKDLNRALEDHGASVVSEIGQGYYLKIEDQEKFLTFQNEMEDHKREKDFKNIIPSEPEDREKYIISKLLLSTLNGRKEKKEGGKKRNYAGTGDFLRVYGTERKRLGKLERTENSKTCRLLYDAAFQAV